MKSVNVRQSPRTKAWRFTIVEMKLFPPKVKTLYNSAYEFKDAEEAYKEGWKMIENGGLDKLLDELE